MAAGTEAVDHSVALGRKADSALNDILREAEDTSARVATIAEAIHRMADGVGAVHDATKHVASVAATTGLAADQMRLQASQVES